LNFTSQGGTFACDGELNSKEAESILRFARALGATSADIRAETDALDEWLR